MTTPPAVPITENVPLTKDESQKITEATIGADKIVVAVHGIGDQYRNATIQTVVSAFGRFARYPASLPLGFFHDASSMVRATRLKGPPEPGTTLGSIGFVEVYWADIPREAQTAGYIIEETKAWARTVVERVRARFGDCALQLDARGPDNEPLQLRLKRDDYSVGADAIEEMIETFKVLDNLLFIAEKAGIIKFDLNYLLTQYVGDVQLVADFANYRTNILNQFRQVLDKVHEANKRADIYLVAHSEGTVVAYMGLLEALSGVARTKEGETRREAPPGWVKQVRGFMTFGSPIDKHIILWPTIWDPLQEPHPTLAGLPSEGVARIRWRNYYDYGDPVGFRLDTTRDWMEVHGWSRFFDFTDKHDYGFGRYLLPGAAHNEYWGDDAVFGHFIHTVMELPVPEGGGSFDQPPGHKPLQRLGANIIPYLLILGILGLGVYLICKGMIEFMTPEGKALSGGGPPGEVLQADAPQRGAPQSESLPGGALQGGARQGATLEREALQGGFLQGHVKAISDELGRNVTGITALLAGMIALARIPRLSRAPKLWIPAIGAFVVGATLYGWLLNPDLHNFHTLHQFQNGHAVNEFVFDVLGEGARGKLNSWGLTSSNVSAAFVILLAAAVAGLAAWGSRRNLREWTSGFLGAIRPFFVRARPLVVPSAVLMLVVIIYGMMNGVGKPLWPLVLASAVFIYLWWLAILLFDLVFVWHRYIRNSVAQDYLFALRKEHKHRRQAEQATAAATAQST